MPRNNIKGIIKFIFLFIFAYCNGVSFTPKMFQKASSTAHLKNERIKDICGKIDYICSQGSVRLCTLRMVDGKLHFKEFDNDCYLFLYNMCEYPDNEWAIKDVGSCKHLNLRRYAEEIEIANQTDITNTEVTTDANTEVTDDITGDMTEQTAEENAELIDDNTGVTADNVELTADDVELATDNVEQATGNVELTTDEDIELRTNETEAVDVQSATKTALRSPTRSTYSVDAAPDDHPCPYHCPSVYSPVCVNINRGYGKYYRLLFFVNHCEADKHYCLHWEKEYKPPPYEDYELVNRPSNAAWSYCAGNKYMNFATFAESAASLGHYGWLMGDQRPSHIMEPYERVPGFG